MNCINIITELLKMKYSIFNPKFCMQQTVDLCIKFNICSKNLTVRKFSVIITFSVPKTTSYGCGVIVIKA